MLKYTPQTNQSSILNTLSIKLKITFTIDTIASD